MLASGARHVPELFQCPNHRPRFHFRWRVPSLGVARLPAQKHYGLEVLSCKCLRIAESPGAAHRPFSISFSLSAWEFLGVEGWGRVDFGMVDSYVNSASTAVVLKV